MKFFIDNDVNIAGIENINDLLNLAPNTKKKFFDVIKNGPEQSNSESLQHGDFSLVNEEHPQNDHKSLFNLVDKSINAEQLDAEPIQVSKSQLNDIDNSNNNLHKP
jgi:hypothetical protein